MEGPTYSFDQVVGFTLTSMKSERNRRAKEDRAIVRYVRPALSEWFEDGQDSNRRPMIEQLWDQTAIDACETWARGVNSMTHNPATDWFAFKDEVESTNDDAETQGWYQRVNEDLRSECKNSGLYPGLLERLHDVGSLARGALYSYEYANDGRTAFEYVSAGECYYTLDRSGLCNSFMRPLYLTVWQIRERGIPISKCAQPVRDAERMNNQETRFLFWHYVFHAKDVPSAPASNHPIIGVYWEQASQKVLDQHGFHDFPFHVLTWQSMPQTPYPFGIGYKALPEVRNLNAYRKKFDRVLDNESDSPLLAANQDEGKEQARPQSGEMIYNGLTGQGQRLYDPLYKSTQGSRSLAAETETSRRIVLETWMNSLMLMLTNSQMTATEVNSRDEKIIQSMGPYIIIMFKDLRSIVMRIFHARMRAGVYDPLPQLFDKSTKLNVEFMGILAKAHKKLTSNAITMFYGESLATIGQTQEGLAAIGRFDHDLALREMGEARALPAGIIPTKAQLEERQAADAEAQRNQMLMEQAPGLAKAAKDGAAAMDMMEQGSNAQAGINLAP